jgi:hypothetical protein
MIYVKILEQNAKNRGETGGFLRVLSLRQRN